MNPVFMACFSLIASAIRMAELFDKSPGANQRLTKLRTLSAEYEKLIADSQAGFDPGPRGDDPADWWKRG